MDQIKCLLVILSEMSLSFELAEQMRISVQSELDDWLSYKHSQICNCTEAKKIWGLRKECSNAVESSLLKSESTSSEACSNYGVHQPECAPQKSNRISDSSQVANRLQVSTENWQRLIEELSTGLQTGMIYGGASAKLSDMAISMPQR